MILAMILALVLALSLTAAAAAAAAAVPQSCQFPPAAAATGGAVKLDAAFTCMPGTVIDDGLTATAGAVHAGGSRGSPEPLSARLHIVSHTENSRRIFG